jgi:hypothetical protein
MMKTKKTFLGPLGIAVLTLVFTMCSSTPKTVDPFVIDTVANADSEDDCILYTEGFGLYVTDIDGIEIDKRKKAPDNYFKEFYRLQGGTHKITYDYSSGSTVDFSPSVYGPSNMPTSITTRHYAYNLFSEVEMESGFVYMLYVSEKTENTISTAIKKIAPIKPRFPIAVDGKPGNNESILDLYFEQNFFTSGPYEYILVLLNDEPLTCLWTRDSLRLRIPNGNYTLTAVWVNSLESKYRATAGIYANSNKVSATIGAGAFVLLRIKVKESKIN